MELSDHYPARWAPAGAAPPVEVSIRLFGWASGESEVEISIPETSELAGMLEGASSEEAAIVFQRLHHHLTAELADAFNFLGAGRETVLTGR